MTVKVVVEPSVEPITVAEAKLFMRETQSDQDAVISAMITAARIHAENVTRRAFVRRKLDLLLPEFPCSGEIEIPKPPLQYIEYIKYIDTSGVLQTVDASEYQVDTDSAPGRVKPAYNEAWEETRNDYNAVQIRYVAGYAESGSPSDQTTLTANIPKPIIQWMKVRVAQMYEHREEVVAGTIVSPLPRKSVDALLDPFIVRMFR